MDVSGQLHALAASLPVLTAMMTTCMVYLLWWHRWHQNVAECPLQSKQVTFLTQILCPPVWSCHPDPHNLQNTYLLIHSVKMKCYYYSMLRLWIRELLMYLMIQAYRRAHSLKLCWTCRWSSDHMELLRSHVHTVHQDCCLTSISSLKAMCNTMQFIVAYSI